MRLPLLILLLAAGTISGACDGFCPMGGCQGDCTPIEVKVQPIDAVIAVGRAFTLDTSRYFVQVAHPCDDGPGRAPTPADLVSVSDSTVVTLNGLAVSSLRTVEKTITVRAVRAGETDVTLTAIGTSGDHDSEIRESVRFRVIVR